MTRRSDRPAPPAHLSKAAAAWWRAVVAEFDLEPHHLRVLERFRVRIDGRPPGAAHGIDVDDEGTGTVTEPRLY